MINTTPTHSPSEQVSPLNSQHDERDEHDERTDSRTNASHHSTPMRDEEIAQMIKNVTQVHKRRETIESLFIVSLKAAKYTHDLFYAFTGDEVWRMKMDTRATYCLRTNT